MAEMTQTEEFIFLCKVYLKQASEDAKVWSGYLEKYDKNYKAASSGPCIDGLEGPTIDIDKIDALIYSIDRVGRRYDGVEYGLPIENETEMGLMRRIIYDWLKAN